MAHSLLRSSVWNLAGGVVPIAFGLVLVPATVAMVGVERFGLLSIAWVVIGYFSVFDLGLGRALTKLVAERSAYSKLDTIAPLLATAQLMIVAVGIAGALLVYFGGVPFVGAVLELSPSVTGEAFVSVTLLALCIPLVTSSAGFRGFLEAEHRFDLVNMVRIPLGIAMFLAPYLAARYSPTLDAMVLWMVASRLLGWLAYLLICRAFLTDAYGPLRPDLAEVRPLVTFGGWMTVSNLVGPIMLYSDRFLIGAVVSAAAVAYYATPYEVVTKLLIIPAALATTLFPSLTKAFHAPASNVPNELERLYRLGAAATLVALLPLILVIGGFARELMFAWLGEDFAANSTAIVRWLSIGVLVNGVAHLPFFLLQAAGRPALLARIHLIELPLYLLALWLALGALGAEGAAMVWAIRAILDAIILSLACCFTRPSLAPGMLSTAWLVTLALVLCGAVLSLTGVLARGVTALSAVILVLVCVWLFLLEKADRSAVIAKLQV